jgi:hypothetical protein
MISLLIASFPALANNQLATDSLSGFKIAVIKGAPGSKQILQGNYVNAINEIKTQTAKPLPQAPLASAYINYELALGMCVANLKLKALTLAEHSCSQAVNLISQGKLPTASPYVKALAYSNRGIVRYLNNDEYGAVDDFTSAILISREPVISHNLSRFKQLALYKSNPNHYAYLGKASTEKG